MCIFPVSTSSVGYLSNNNKKAVYQLFVQDNWVSWSQKSIHPFTACSFTACSYGYYLVSD